MLLSAEGWCYRLRRAGRNTTRVRSLWGMSSTSCLQCRGQLHSAASQSSQPPPSIRQLGHRWHRVDIRLERSPTEPGSRFIIASMDVKQLGWAPVPGGERASIMPSSGL